VFPIWVLLLSAHILVDNFRGSGLPLDRASA
jgi:hypothetical protein